MSSVRERKLAFVAWITVCFVWGTTYLAIRIGLESVPVALLGGLRWTAAGMLLVAIAPLVGQRLPALRELGGVALVGFLMNVVGNGLVVWAEQFVASGLAAVVVAMVPFWTVFVEAVLPGGERLSWRALGGLTLGFLGIVVLLWPELRGTTAQGSAFVFGVLALQVACFGWALGTSLTKRKPSVAGPIANSGMQMLFGGLMLLAIGTASGEWGVLAFTTRTAAAMIYLTLVGSIVGYSAFLYAIKHLPVSTVSLYAYVNPIIAVILGTLILAEPFDVRIVVSAAMVFCGILIVRSSASRRSARVKSPDSRSKAVA
ncbi:MAG: EamA family transporter [Vicinamibacterales bacterium]